MRSSYKVGLEKLLDRHETAMHLLQTYDVKIVHKKLELVNFGAAAPWDVVKESSAVPGHHPETAVCAW